MNRLVLMKQYLEDPQVSSFRPKRTSALSKAKTKSSKCPQYSEAPVGSDEFVLDVLQFFFEERLNPSQLNDRLRQVAADAVWRATQGSDAMDLVPRPPSGAPGPVWLISQAVQIAFRKAQNRCIYEAVRVVVKAALRSEYEFAKIGAEAQSYVRPFANNLVISDQGINFIKQFEAFKPNLYNDPVGHCTIGYGTLVHRGNCNGSESEEYKAGLSEQRATELLRQEVWRIEEVINASVTVSLNQSQFDSLVSFAYNIGTGAFKKSTLLKKLNQGDYAAVPVELKRWVKGGGKTLPGLVRRRAAEAGMFTNGTYSTSSSLYSRSRGFPTALGDVSFDYNVPGTVPIIAQPSGMTCWATVATMMVSWHDQKSYTIQSVMDKAGPVYRAKFDNNEGLAGSEKGAFLMAVGMQGEPPMGYTVDGLKSLLETYGPLWATTDEQPGAGFSIHARIITGIYGDGTVDGTSLRINDPDGGRQYTETFRTFMQKYEEVTGTGNLRVQIVHF